MEGLWSKAEPQEPDITDWKELDEHAQRMEAAAPCQFIQSCKAQAQANPGITFSTISLSWSFSLEDRP